MPSKWSRPAAATLLVGLAAVAAGCASSGARPRPFPTPGGGTTGGRTGASAVPPAPAPTPPATAIVATALHLRGTPYRDGGSDTRGFDCSGFTQYVYAQAGALLPREVRDQFRVGKVVGPGEQRAGDLVFFTTTAPGASHVGIALGPDTFIHAPSSRGVVRVERISVPYWSRRLVGIRRIVEQP